ncbi:hypothetical protein EII17_07550 [Clostridiales bacterium COT073_COT-073]|nr:hypothetical protein EII17_07550 [Clostridiales bacterium COT073_COT-073]
MRKNNKNGIVNKGGVLLLMIFLAVSLSACSGLKFNFSGDEKAKTESKDKKNSEEDKGDKAEKEEEEEADANKETEKKSKSKKQKNVKKDQADAEKKSEKTSSKNKTPNPSKVKVWGNKDKTGEQAENTKKSPKEKTSQKGKKELLTDEEARQIILKEYREYEQVLTKEGFELDLSAPVGANADQYLFSTLNDDSYHQAMQQYGFDYGVHLVREVYPGPYMTYLLFPDLEAQQTFISSEEWVPVACFYINLKTGMVFFAAGPSGIYRLPDDQLIWYVPDAFEGYSNLDFLLSGLAKAGYIESKWDYTWKYDLRKWDFENPPYSEGEEPEGCARIMLFHRQTQEYLGCFEIEKATQSIYDVETKELIYQNPAANYPKKKITAQNAAQETEDIVRQLEFLDFDKQKLTFLAGDSVFFEEINEKAYSIGVKVGDDEHISYLFFINHDGTKVGSFNHASQSYDIIYGNHMW